MYESIRAHASLPHGCLLTAVGPIIPDVRVRVRVRVRVNVRVRVRVRVRVSVSVRG